MANGSTLEPGYKFVDPEDSRKGAVLESVTFGEGFTGALGATIGERCAFGNNVSLYWSSTQVGDDVKVGDSVTIRESRIGNGVKIGNECILDDGVMVEDNAVIGSDVYLGRNVKVKRGVIIPDNWDIPPGCIVNPGPNGFPVVIPPQPQFHCNVTANRNW